METAKLTLRPSRDVIELARQMAKEEKTSITQLFSSFVLARRRARKSGKKIPLGPLTREISGILKMPADWDYKKEMGDILEEKYGDRP